MPRGYFWVGTGQGTDGSGSATGGPMYVQWESPAEVRQPLPVVLVHGGGGQGLDFLGTPDGRCGWAELLVREGYIVFIVDRPGHGRSPYDSDVLGAAAPPLPIENYLGIFAPPALADKHIQWPFGRGDDDPRVRQLAASVCPMPADWSAMHAVERERMAELLDRVGPSIVFCHSAGGPAGFLAGDARPELVKGLVAIETVGPPFVRRDGISLDWGIAATPMTFEPPATDPSQLSLIVDTDRPNPLTLQQEPARRLKNLARVPIAVVTADVSPFTGLDDHLIAYLRQAGCDVDCVRLAEHGVHGNGHGMMFEKNNRQVLQVILDWLERRGLATRDEDQNRKLPRGNQTITST